jgi:hypothetical protein
MSFCKKFATKVIAYFRYTSFFIFFFKKNPCTPIGASVAFNFQILQLSQNYFPIISCKCGDGKPGISAQNTFVMNYLDPKNDFILSKIFGRHPHLLTSFLNAILPLPEGSFIESLEYLPVELALKSLQFNYTAGLPSLSGLASQARVLRKASL